MLRDNLVAANTIKRRIQGTSPALKGASGQVNELVQSFKATKKDETGACIRVLYNNFLKHQNVEQSEAKQAGKKRNSKKDFTTSMSSATKKAALGRRNLAVS